MNKLAQYLAAAIAIGAIGAAANQLRAGGKGISSVVLEDGGNSSAR